MSRAIQSIGYFDDPAQISPKHDPWLCAICGGPIAPGDRLCRDLMMLGGQRSYFFGWHKGCDDKPRLAKIEAQIVTEMEDLEGFRL